MRPSTISVLPAAAASGLLVWLAAGVAADAPAPNAGRPVSAATLRESPLTIAASTTGDFRDGHPWHLSVNSAGQAELTIETLPEPTRRRFDIPAARLAELREALLEERFFELANEYGEVVPGGSEETITVAAGGTAKTVRLHFLMNWVHGDRAKLRDPARAVRLGLMIRGWFDDAEAVDLRRYDRMVLEASGRGAEPAAAADRPTR